jgi:hypothetical protein
MNWIPAFAGMTDEEKINRGFRVSKSNLIYTTMYGKIIL